ncbi:short-chain alcohol dehydrogenase family [mine drainage metagenome]|uniref:trans-2-enoyl-CoA reductase (NAD(+)) n=2 Tax=mine drainage metagenome TaxID=410659 RepID=T1BFB3_9ZZZZ
MGVRSHGPKRVLVIGASTGYGLAARITCAFGFGAATLGIFFEKKNRLSKAGSAGWYNSAAFDKLAKQSGLWSRSVNGDAFSHEARACTVDLIKREMGGSIDLLIYSLASPLRRLPDTREIIRSTLKPIGMPYDGKTIDTDQDRLTDIHIKEATEQEISDTITVMGGEDWALWIEALHQADAFAQNVKTVAFSYIGTEMTWPVYRHGTIGHAKKNLERTALILRNQYRLQKLNVHVAIMKATITQASAFIPVMPLYGSMLFRVMKEKKLHENIIQQQNRLFRDYLYRIDVRPPAVDAQGRLRLDDRELRDDVQRECKKLWSMVTDENLLEITDYLQYKNDFQNLFGFARRDIDYHADSDIDAHFDCIEL